MKKYYYLFIIVFLIGCSSGMSMKNIILAPTDEKPADSKDKFDMLIQPHQSLGLEPTKAIRSGSVSIFMAKFPPRLFGEYFPGRLRWNAWTILEDGSERFSQVIFAGMHPSGDYFGILVVDGKNVSSAQTVILSSSVNYIYSPFGEELEIERENFLADSTYRSEKIKEVNKDFSINLLTSLDEFQDVFRNWNQIQYPEGYLLAPYGTEEVASIRGINPQYTFFEKLVGTGKFRVSPSINPVGLVVTNSIGLMMDMIGAWNAPTTGWDYLSEIPNRRNMAFVIEYLLVLAQKEIKERNIFNQKLLLQANAEGER